METSAKLTAVLLYPDTVPPTITQEQLDRPVFNFFSFAKSETGQSIHIVIPPRTTRLVRTGIRVKPKSDFDLYLLTRFSMISSGISILTTAVTYSSELLIPLYNGGHESFYVRHGDPIAQGILLASSMTLNSLEIRAL